ncbi:hypothetical protein DERP_002294 [Dermatophagoides pteronyssinus]|uniref:Uncharacterized protein n=1 Tax=Dermatophagoides pteronyssinus TaxID=6956 RepID=A0ABQ8JHD2_DERPT|nr:hypothetical protein DERP_002294 [Dermatophagoides pteronyssinus]
MQRQFSNRGRSKSKKKAKPIFRQFQKEMATYINDEQPTHKKENVSKKINLDDDDGYFILVLEYLGLKSTLILSLFQFNF